MHTRLLIAIVILHSSFNILPAAPPPELTVLRTQYDKVVAERVTAPFEAAKGDLDAKFTGALDRIADEAKMAGKLEDVLAILEDKKRLAQKFPLPEDDDKTSEPLKKLRAIYHEQLKKLEDQRTANHQTILPAYTAKLQTLETTLTKADRVEEAKEVMDYRTSLKADAPAPQPAMTASTPTTTSATTAPPPTASASKIKGDDRKAAEWVLSVGGNVRLWDNSTGLVVYSADKLPKGDFSIRSISLDNNKGGLKPFTDADFAALAGLERLEAITIYRVQITPAAFDALSTCPKLVQISVQYNALGDALWERLAACPSLQRLGQNYDKLPVTGVGISRLNRELFDSLELGMCPISDEGLAEIGTFGKLTKLNLDSSKITDAGMKHLATLKKLESLNVRNTNITVAGLASVRELPLTLLGYGKTMSETAAQAPEVAALFPKVNTLSLPRECDPAAEEWAAIAKSWPKLKRIAVNSRELGDASCAAMQSLASLEELDLQYCPITDAGVTSLSSLKKLHWLYIAESKITDTALETLAGMKGLKVLKLPKPAGNLSAEGIAQFKKKRPDIEVR